MHAEQPQRTIEYDDIALLKLGSARTNGFDFPALKHKARLKAFLNGVIVESLPVFNNTHKIPASLTHMQHKNSRRYLSN
jgi:hypothetical protein